MINVSAVILMVVFIILLKSEKKWEFIGNIYFPNNWKNFNIKDHLFIRSATHDIKLFVENYFDSYFNLLLEGLVTGYLPGSILYLFF